MDDLVQTLLDDLSHNLDRLADALEADQPVLAMRLRVESGEVPLASESSRAPLRPLLYDALAAGAIESERFDRLMLLDARVRAVRRDQRTSRPSR